jgi:hypothetical protein
LKINNSAIAYFLLTRKEMYVDLGEDYFDKQKQQSIVRYAHNKREESPDAFGWALLLAYRMEIQYYHSK